MKGSMMNFMMMVFITLVIAFMGFLAYSSMAGMGNEEIGFIKATPITQRIASVINIISSSPQNQTTEFEINPLNCTITFDAVRRLVETDAMLKSKYRMYLFNDTEIHAPSNIECNHGKTIIHINKEGDAISVRKE